MDTCLPAVFTSFCLLSFRRLPRQNRYCKCSIKPPTPSQISYLVGYEHLSDTAISRKVVGWSARDNLERYCGWFWVYCFSKKFERIVGEAMDLCLRVLKESNKNRFDSYSVWNRVLSSPILPLGVVACTFFPTTFLEIAVSDSPL